MRNFELTRCMIGYVVASLCCMTASTSVHAGWPEPATLDTPLDLHTLFVEAEGEVQVKTIRNMPPLAHYGGVNLHWIDNHRLIYTVRQLKGWQAQKEDRAKIIIFNVDTGEIEETPYRGDLVCFGSEGQMLVQDYPVPIKDFLLPGDTEEDSQYYLTGRLGEVLTRFKRPREHGMLDYFSCRFYDNSNHEFGGGALPYLFVVETAFSTKLATVPQTTSCDW